MNLTKLNSLPAKARNSIINSTLKQIFDNREYPHSLQTIVSEQRELSIASRMISKPLEFPRYILNSKKEIEKQGQVILSGEDIADIFIDSIKKFGHTYYPITGDWRHIPVEYLILFTKVNNIYVPYARFRIENVEESSPEEVIKKLNILEKMTDITLIMNYKFKSLIKISDVETENLPKTFLGINSGIDIYECAFKGRNPNIVVI